MKYCLIALVIMNLTGVAQIPPSVPTNGLVGWYPFNGNANDLSVNANNGTVNGATITTDRFGNPMAAYEFNGSSQTIEAPITVGTYTISLWYFTNSLPNSFNNLFTYNNSYAELSDDSTVYARVQYPSPPSLSLITNYVTSLDQWHHLLITYQASTNLFDIYIDSINHFSGILTSDGVYHPNWNNDTIYLGGIKLNNTNYFAGKIDDVGIWDRVLTLEEIATVYTGNTGNVGIGTTNPQRKLHVHDVIRLEPRNTAPSSPARGDIYFDGILNKLRVYDGTTWQNCW